MKLLKSRLWDEYGEPYGWAFLLYGRDGGVSFVIESRELKLAGRTRKRRRLAIGGLLRARYRNAYRTLEINNDLPTDETGQFYVRAYSQACEHLNNHLNGASL